MTILSALFSGVSGLDAYSDALSVIGNNIANVNTTGFKASRAEFADILSQSLSGGSGNSQIGRGVYLSSVSNVFSQGSFETTSNATDMAIDGDGFFIVNNGTGDYYSRAGQFSMDKSGRLANPEGYFLQGYALDSATGVVASPLEDINIASTSAAPKATTTVNIAANLDSTSAVKDTAGYATSSGPVTSGFTFVTGTNDVIEWNNGTGTVPASLTTDGGLTSGQVYTGAQVATAIKTALEATNASADLYDVTYDPNTQKFTITNNTGNTNPITLDWANAASTAGTALGFNATNTAVPVSSSDTSDNATAFNVLAGVNDKFTMSVDGVPSSASITIDPGIYTTSSLAAEMQSKIRADSAFTGKNITVDYGSTVPDRFTITSDTTGTSSAVTVTPDATEDFLQTIDMASGGTSTAVLNQGDTLDPFNPVTSSNFSTSITGYDSLGNPHTINVYFRKDSSNTWSWSALVDGGDITGGTPGVNVQEANGQLTFTTDGALNTETTNSSSFNFSGGATQGQAINFDFGTAILTNGGTGLDGTTQFAGTSSTISQSQDGYSSGQLQSISINQQGIITGMFSNGQTQQLAQVALARFLSTEGLHAAGGNRFSETINSGQPIVGVPDTGGRGQIASNSLELSNVDLGSEFVDMIKTQQAYEANSRVISTTNTLLTDLVNIIR